MPSGEREQGTGEGSPPDQGSPSLNSMTPTQTNLELSDRLSPGTLVAGRYRILSMAGVGGMGIVYRARDEELNAEVALKVLRADLGSDPKVLERFRGELRLARQVSHKNVVRIHDIGEHKGLRFLTMRFVEGRSLREVLEREGPLPLERAAPIIRQVAEGLEQAHAAGVVHRDLKPANILLDSSDTAYITDFGVARSLEGGGLTRAGGVVGTPDYLSPEQIAGDPVDGRADIYALGIVFYETLTGELPFRGGSQAEMLAQRLAGRPRDLSETGVRAPAHVRAVIRRCLERSTARRYPNARAFLEDLDRGRASGVSRRLPKALIAAAVALLLIGAWALTRGSFRLPFQSAARQQPATPSPALHAVAVLPLLDETARQDLRWTSTGVADMLSGNLAETPNLRVLDSQRVLRGVKDLHWESGRYEERALRQLAELWSVDSLVTGSIRGAGQRVRLDLRLHRIEPGGLSTRQLGGETARLEGLFDLVSSLAGRLRNELGVKGSDLVSEPEPQTKSLAAARAYQEGRERLLVGDEIGAAPALERAVAADPGYGAALERLSETYQSLGYQEKASAAAERALSVLGEGRSRLAYRARARSALLRGNPKEAEAHYRELARRYPSDTEPRLDLASAQAAQGHHAEALDTLKAVVEVDPKDPRAWLLLGRSATLTGEGSRAVNDYLVKALALQNQLGNEKGKADVLAAIAAAHQRLAAFPQALESYTVASRIQKAIGDEQGLATTLRSRSQIHQAMGRVSEAEEDLASARRLFTKIGDRKGLSGAWNAFGVLQESRGAYREALNSYQEALKIRRGLGDERLLAQSYDNVGYIFYLQGEYDNAQVYWQQALDLRRRIGEKSGVVLSLQNLGFLQTAQGKWDEALKSFVEALERAREIDLKDAIAISLGNMGILYQLQGRPAAALDSFDEALGVARGLEFKAALTEFTIKKGHLLLKLGKGELVEPMLSQAQAWVKETGNSEQSADLEVLRGEWHLARSEVSLARRAFGRAVPLAKESGSKVSHLHARIASGRGALEGGDSAGATAALASALVDAEALSHALLQIEAGAALASAHLARRRTRQAEETIAKAVRLAEETGWEAGLYELYALEGKIRQAAGDRAGALEAFRKSQTRAVKLAEGLTPELRASFEMLPSVRGTVGVKGP